jgi:hypothetical protein
MYKLKGNEMFIDELETIASRLRAIINEGWEFGQNRNTILANIEELLADIEDQADTLALAIAEYHRENA